MSGLFVSLPSFLISDLARLRVKPRLCRSSWRAFASTHPLMLPSTCSREALVACPPFPPWNLPLFTVESTLSTPCSRSDPPLSRQGVALAHLDSLLPHDLVLWTDGSVPFPFGKGGSGVLGWQDGERYLHPLQSLVVSLLLPLKSTLILSRTGGILFHRSSLTHRFPRFPPRNLCSLVMLAVSSLVFAAMDTAFF